MDLILAAVLLIALAPVMLLVAAAIRLSLGSPVLFRQTRAGRGGQPFTIIKFRTMIGPPAEGSDPVKELARIPRFGRYLRATGIDELPQLWNVVRGDMSLVGPRPLYTHYLSLYTPEQAKRLEVRPGITGWAQVKGRTSLEWPEQLRLDAWYVDNQSLWLDLAILIRSAGVVLGQRTGGTLSQRPEFTGEPAPRSDQSCRADTSDRP